MSGLLHCSISVIFVKTAYLKRASDPISSATGIILSHICTISSFSVFESIIRRRGTIIIYLYTTQYKLNELASEQRESSGMLRFGRFAVQFLSHINHKLCVGRLNKKIMQKWKSTTVSRNVVPVGRSLQLTGKRVNHVRGETAQR